MFDTVDLLREDIEGALTSKESCRWAEFGPLSTLDSTVNPSKRGLDETLG